MKRQMREYLARTTGIDRILGRVLDLLDELLLTEKTIVIFYSDHGYNMGHNGIRHKCDGIWATRKPPTGTHRGTEVISNKHRPNMHHHSLRVPAIIRWPGAVNPKTTIYNTASSLDFFPTISTMAEIEFPSDLPIRGRSLVLLLKRESPDNSDQDLHTEYNMTNYANADMHCSRTPKYN